jgi:hypothetical protein
MLAIDDESIKRVTNGDLIVRGNPEEILKSKYEDGWCVVNNFRENEELEVERSGILTSFPSLVNVKRKLAYGEIIDNDWYILDAELH